MEKQETDGTVIAILGLTERKLHAEDFKKATHEKLLKTVAKKNQVCFTKGNGTLEYGYVTSDKKGKGVFVKFSHTLLGFLYTDDAWQATTSVLCDRSQIEFVNPEND